MGKPEVLLHIAVRLTYVVVMEIDVMVLVPNASRNLLDPKFSGTEKPG